MLRFVKKNVTPPGGFRYIDPDTGQRFKAPHMAALVKQATLHRRANELEVPKSFPGVIEDWICQRLPKGHCDDPGGGPIIYRSHYRSAESSVRATMALNRINDKTTGTMVDKKVANRRAKICASCYQNIPFAGCMSCRGVKSILESVKRGRTTDHDKRLMACGVVGVLNQVQVYMKPETIAATTKKIVEYPDTCWKRDIVGSTNAGPREDTVRTGVGGKSTRRTARTRGNRHVRSPRQAVAQRSDRPRRKPRRCCGGSR